MPVQRVEYLWTTYEFNIPDSIDGQTIWSVSPKVTLYGETPRVVMEITWGIPTQTFELLPAKVIPPVVKLPGRWARIRDRLRKLLA